MQRYDELSYASAPIAEADPSRLFALAALFGVPVPSRWRVLDVGCGAGGHLVPLAARHPGDEWVGFDLAASPVERAVALAARLGARVDVFQADLRDVDAALSEPGRPAAYDLIVAHGVYSWVPDDARAALWRLFSRWLAPTGIAYLSVNTLPGWGQRSALGGALRYLAGDAPPAEQIGRARAFVAWLAEVVPPADPYGAWLRREAELVREQSDSWLFHDLLAPVNKAFFLHEVVASAEAAGLRYVGDARLDTMLPDRLPAEIAAKLASLGGGQVQQEQLMDFVVGRSFRRAVFCRSTVRLERTLAPSALRGLLARGTLVREGRGRYRNLAGDELETEVEALDALFGGLADARPAASEIDALVEGPDADRLRRNLLVAATRGLVELLARPDGLTGAVSARPVAEPVAAALATDGAVPSPLGHRVRLDPVARAVLPLLDGSRDVNALASLLANVVDLRDAVGAAVPAPAVRAWLQVELPQRLRQLAREGLLTG